MKEKTYYCVVGVWGILLLSLIIGCIIFTSINDYQSAFYCMGIALPIACLGYGIPLISPWGL